MKNESYFYSVTVGFVGDTSLSLVEGENVTLLVQLLSGSPASGFVVQVSPVSGTAASGK